MLQERINEEWLFKTNSKEEISRWISNLKYSYLWKRPSFRDDGDYIKLTLNFTDRADLLITLGVLGIALNTIPENFPKPIVGKKYDWTEFEKFKSEIKDYPEFEQPLGCVINNTPAFVWIENGKIDFTFSDNYGVSEQDYLNCLNVESEIEKNNLSNKVNRDIESNIGCVTKSKYPTL
nr:hypothetical protein [uncultured Mucilaginibacter sp.]